MPKVKIVFYRERKNKEISVPKGTKVIDVLRRLRLNPVEYVVALNGLIVPEDEEIVEDSELEVLPVVSGG
mgnify:CR=1 FL=1